MLLTIVKFYFTIVLYHILHFTLKNTISNLVPSDLAIGDSWHPASDCGRIALVDDSVQRVDDGLRRLTTYR